MESGWNYDCVFISFFFLLRDVVKTFLTIFLFCFVLFCLKLNSAKSLFTRAQTNKDSVSGGRSRSKKYK